MKTEIIAFNLGLISCYLIIGKDIVMIDAGEPKKLQQFKKILAKNKIDPARIKLAVITHSHFDHCGSARDIRDFTGAKIAIHESERDCVEHVILNSGEAIVGCMAHNGWPFRFKPGLPVLAQDIDAIKENWKMLINKGVTFAYPGHGKPFPVEVIKNQLIT